jgi:hypothetical protein
MVAVTRAALQCVLFTNPINLIIRMIKSGRMGLSDHVIRSGEVRNIYAILDGKPESRRPVGDVGQWYW